MFTMGEESIRVLIVDDEFIMRQGLRYMIHWEEEGFTIVGEAANGKDAMDQIEKLQPQIVLSDVVMPLMDGVDFTVAVHHRYPHVQMIILSGYDNFEYVNFAEKAQGDEVVYAQDRWCGLYCFNADADPSDSNFSLGWYDLWNASLFFKGSVQAAAANTNIPSSIKLLKNEMKLSEMKPLSATEKLHMQSLIRQNLKMKSIR